MERIFDLLIRKEQKATFFCLGWVAREFPHLIKKIDSLGFEIATHSDRHQLAYKQNRAEFSNDLENSIKSIEDVIGKKIITYRAPGFSIKENNKWVFEELVKNGIEIDCSVFPAKRSHGGFESYGHAQPTKIIIDGFEIKEFPINIYRVGTFKIIFSGGGYFRLIPYPLIRRMMNRSPYVMTYFHPRDFDPNQPVIQELTFFRKFKSYVGLSTAFEKLELLISEYKFIDLATADSQMDWGLVKKVKL